MTLTFSKREFTYNPVVSTTTFSVTFPIFDNSDLIVLVKGVETEDYSVSATYTNGRSTNASIILFTPVSSGTVTIRGRRNPRIDRSITPTTADVINTIALELDRTSASAQEMARDVEDVAEGLDLVEGQMVDLLGGVSGAAYADRATHAAAEVPAPVIRTAHYSAGGDILRFVEDAFGTALVTADGRSWSPDGNVTPNHWAENTVPDTTNMVSAIEAAVGYAAPLRKPVYLIDRTYRCSRGLVFRLRDVTLIGRTGQGTNSQITIYGGAAESSFLFEPVNATLPATAAIINLHVENITLYRPSAGSTGAGFHIRKATSVVFRNVFSWGHKHNWLMEGVKNCEYDGISGAAVNYAGGTGSAQVKIDHLIQSDGSEYAGFTHRFSGGGIMSGAVYEATLEIGHNDFCSISGGYWGFCKINVLLKPSTATARVINTEIDNVYLDGGTSPSAQVGIKMEAGAGGSIDFVKMTGGVIGQMDRGIWIASGAKVSKVTLNGVDFHNSVREAIFAATAEPMDLSVTGGNIWNWARNGTAVGDENNAIRVSGGRSVSVSGVNFRPYDAQTKPAIFAANMDSLFVADCVGVQLTTPVAYSAVGSVILRSNKANVEWKDLDSTKRGLWTPALSFAGGETGMAYASRSASYTRSNGRVYFSINVTLSAKGSASGNARITLPTTILAGRDFCCSMFVSAVSASTGRVGYVGVMEGGLGYIALRYLTEAGGQANMTEADFTNGSVIVISGFYDD